MRRILYGLGGGIAGFVLSVIVVAVLHPSPAVITIGAIIGMIIGAKVGSSLASPSRMRRPLPDRITAAIRRARQQGDYSVLLMDDEGYVPIPTERRPDYEITYEDMEGRISRRRITVIGLSMMEDEIAYIVAYCHTRDALRCFVLDRIREAVRPDTGEVLTHEQLAMQLLEITGQHGALARHRLADVWEEAVLLALAAMADGRLMRREVDIFRRFAREVAGLDLTERDARRLIRDIADREGIGGYTKAIGRLRMDGTRAQQERAVSYIREMVGRSRSEIARAMLAQAEGIIAA